MRFGQIERVALVLLVLALGGAAAATASQSSRAAFPGLNGRIVFNDQSGSIMLVNPNGSGVVRVARTYRPPTRSSARRSRATGSGSRTARYSSSDPDIFMIRPDGSDQRQVTFSRGSDVDPAFSGDGSRIAFETDRNGNVDIYSVDAGGTGGVRLTTAPENELDPAWSPTGDRIAYTVESGGSRARSG